MSIPRLQSQFGEDPTTRASAGRFVVIAFAICVAGCSALLSAEEDQCELDADCEGRGFAGAVCSAGICVAPSSGVGGAAGGGGVGGSAGAAGSGGGDPKWGCIGNVTWPSPTPTEKITSIGEYRRLIGEDPIVGMTVKLCSRLDFDCASPVDSGVTDDKGQLTLKLFKGFDGFSVIAPPASFPTMMPGLLFVLPPPEQSNLEVGEPVHVVAATEIDLIASVIGQSTKPELGHIFGLAIDCTGATTAGVTLTVDTVAPETVGYYVAASGLPSATQGETGPDGEAGWINVPPGLVTITSTSVDAGKTGSVAALVKAGHVSYVPLPPTP